MAPGEQIDRGMRAADADREKVADELRTHCVDGRITLEELDQRLQGAMSAVTIGELAGFVSDLPTIAVRSRPGRTEPTPRVGLPGILPFTRRLVVPTPPERTRDVTLDTIAPALNAYGYELIRQSANGLVFERRSRSGGKIAAAALFFPLGLLALLGRRQHERIVISFEARGPNDTNMTIHGAASRSVRKHFARLTFS
jgi:hypothetical protein